MFIPRPMWFITGIGGIWIRATAFDDFSPLQKCRPAMLPGFPLPMQICGVFWPSPAIEPRAGKCSYIKKTRFGRNNRQTKSSSEKGFFAPFGTALSVFFHHIGTRKSSKIVVIGRSIVNYRCGSRQIPADSVNAAANEQYFYHLFISIYIRLFAVISVVFRTFLSAKWLQIFTTLRSYTTKRCINGVDFQPVLAAFLRCQAQDCNPPGCCGER